jgi:hypothetical protein
MSSAIAALTDKGFADLYPEDGPTVGGGDNIEARALDAYRRSARLDVCSCFAMGDSVIPRVISWWSTVSVLGHKALMACFFSHCQVRKH